MPQRLFNSVEVVFSPKKTGYAQQAVTPSKCFYFRPVPTWNSSKTAIAKLDQRLEKEDCSKLPASLQIHCNFMSRNSPKFHISAHCHKPSRPGFESSS